jgi:succinate dehydrogenase/fumarate reductase flavoprotein subunit
MSSAEENGKRFTRRQFVKGSAVAGAAGLLVGAGGTGLVLTDIRKPGLPAEWNYETDVVIVGSGFAGSNAAIASHDAGAKVLVLEKAPERFAGGNSSVSGGGLRIPTNVPDAVKYYRALGFGTVPEDLCTDLAEAMAKVPHQLKNMGIHIEPVRMFAGLPMGMASTKPAPRPPARPASGLNLLPGSASSSIYAIIPDGEKTARMGTGHQLYLAHKRCMLDRKIQVMFETPAKELIQDPETKAILGVAAEQNGRRIYVKGKRAVVLACGGYEADSEMQEYFNYPGIKIYPWGTPYNTGDGIKMMSEIGAPLWHMFSIEWDGPCVKVPSEQHAVSIQTSILTVAGIPGNYILVNKYGKRFMNDVKSLTHSKESLELTYFDYERVEYPNLPFYIVFDEMYRQRHPLVPPKTMSWNGIHRLVEWSKDNSAEIEKGWILKADSIRELAAKMGIDEEALERTVFSYNEYCRAGKDAEFSRRKDTLLPVKTPPYYSAELALTCTNTQGGPKHNGKAQTLDKDNKPIPRLYTPGEMGSFFGFLYPGGSNIPEAIAFGRIAGENAAAEEPWTS